MPWTPLRSHFEVLLYVKLLACYPELILCTNFNYFTFTCFDCTLHCIYVACSIYRIFACDVIFLNRGGCHLDYIYIYMCVVQNSTEQDRSKLDTHSIQRNELMDSPQETTDMELAGK